MAFAPSPQRSGPAGTPAASQTMISTTLTSDGMIKRFVFGSEWYFKPDGVKSVVTRFQKELDKEKLTAEVQWNRVDYTFRLSCQWATSEQVWGIFFKTVQSLITQESAEGWNDDSDDENESLVEDSDDGSQPTQSTKIQHLSEWKKENGIIDIMDDESEIEAEDDTAQLTLGISFPVKVRHYKWKTIWEYQGTSPSLDEIVSGGILRRLAVLIGCEFVKDSNHGAIYIGASSEEDCSRAVCKLDNINKNRGMRFIKSKHLFYTEDIENYQISFKFFIEVKKKFFETTLLDNLQLSTARFDYRTLPSAVTVRCSTFDAMKSRYLPFKIGKYYAAVDIDNRDSGSKEWEGFTYNPCILKGQEVDNAMTRFNGCEPRPKEAHIAQQPQQHQAVGEEIADGKVHDWFLAQEQEDVADSPANPPKATITDRFQGYVTENAHVNGETRRLVTFDSVDQQKYVSSNILDENTPWFEIPALQPTKLGLERSTLDLPPNDPFGSPTRALPSHPVPPFETMQPAMNQKAPKANKKLPSSSSKSGSLRDRLEIPSPPPARRPPKINHFPTIDPLPEFISSINASFQELLQGLRGFQGGLSAQAEFGRILLKNVPHKCITHGELDASVDPEYGYDVLANPNSQPVPIFTRILTVVPADISFLVNMNDQKGNALWERNQLDWDVIYEFLCVDERRAQPFSVDFSGEKLSHPQVKIRRDFGAINVHGVKRHWDFRISATGAEHGDNIDPAYNELAQAVKGSLHIPEGVRTPLLFFEIPEHLSSLSIFSIRVRRISRYPSIDGKSILSVSEVHELKPECRSVAGYGFALWKAVAHLEPSANDTTRGDLKYKRLFFWHEVFISCPKADEMFEQNRTVELGEETSWTTENLSKVDALQSMYLPACAMLRQMDGVGFYNNNECDPEESQSAISSAQAEPPAPYYFW